MISTPVAAFVVVCLVMTRLHQPHLAKPSTIASSRMSLSMGSAMPTPSVLPNCLALRVNASLGSPATAIPVPTSMSAQMELLSATRMRTALAFHLKLRRGLSLVDVSQVILVMARLALPSTTVLPSTQQLENVRQTPLVLPPTLEFLVLANLVSRVTAEPALTQMSAMPTLAIPLLLAKTLLAPSSVIVKRVTLEMV